MFRTYIVGDHKCSCGKAATGSMEHQVTGKLIPLCKVCYEDELWLVETEPVSEAEMQKETKWYEFSRSDSAVKTILPFFTDEYARNSLSQDRPEYQWIYNQTDGHWVTPMHSTNYPNLGRKIK